MSEVTQNDRGNYFRLTLADHIAHDAGEDLPEIDLGPGYACFDYPAYNLTIMLEKLTLRGEAEVKVWAGQGELLQGLAWQKINLMSHSGMVSLIRDLKSRAEHIPWDSVLRQSAWRAVQHARNGHPIQEIWPAEDTSLAPDYLVRPVLYRGHPSVIFGMKGTHKSALALVIAYIAQLPLTDNSLGFAPGDSSTRCLILDYEDDSGTFAKRWGALQRGFAVAPAMPILYRRMAGPLSDSVEEVQRLVHERDIKLLIIDSLGPAAGGSNLNDSQPAIAYNAALREIGITSLTLAHSSKDEQTRRKTIYGSVFFANLARSVWEVKQEQEPGEDEAVVSLRNTEANLSGLHPALGFMFSYSEDTISVKATDLRDTGLSGELPLSLQVKGLLRGGAMPIKSIAAALDANEGSVKTTIYRLAKKGLTVKVGEAWGLGHDE